MTVLNKQSIETAFDLMAATIAVNAATATLLFISPIHVMDVEVFEHNIVGRTKVVFANLDTF